MERHGQPDRVDACLRYGMEVIVAALVCLSPWAFGAVHPFFAFLCLTAIALLLTLWAARLLWTWEWRWHACPVLACLVGLLLLGALQLVPLPSSLLAKLSPGTARLYEQVLPQNSEVGPGGESIPLADLTVSFYPGATRGVLIQLLAVVALYAVVRNNLGNTAIFTRLSVALLVNGVLLALLGVSQVCSSPPNTLYWHFERAGTFAFGPFICRNHYPFYLNMCIGMGVALFLICHRQSEEDATGPNTPWSLSRLLQPLHEPATLWIILGLGFMIASVVISLSRGGVLALIGSTLVCLMLRATQPGRSVGLIAFLATGAIVLGLLAWVHFPLLESRLATIWKGALLQDNRWNMWAYTLPLTTDFPVWGTGYGTFTHLEPLRRPPGESNEVWNFAHNDYLEALIEGGILRLALSLLAIGLILHYGVRAFRQGQDHATRCLALGGLFGFLAFVLHSFGDFGLHVPANTILATVICAQLSAIGRPVATTSQPRRGLAPLAGALTMLALAAVLLIEGRRADRTERFRLAAVSLEASGDQQLRKQRIAMLEAAAHAAPADAELQIELAEEWIRYGEKQQGMLDRRRQARLAAQCVKDFFAMQAGLPMEPVAGTVALLSTPSNSLSSQHDESNIRNSHVAAVRAYLRGRNACPLLSKAQIGLATQWQYLLEGDPRSAYLARAKLVRPFDDQLWYICGVQESNDQQWDLAYRSWWHALSCSDHYLDPILERCQPRLMPADIFAKVLPDQPALLRACAWKLLPSADAAAERSAFLTRALLALQQQPQPWSADSHFLEGELQRDLGHLVKAQAAYQAALALEPSQIAWRYTLAEVLVQQGRTTDASRELRLILGQQPNHALARRLLSTLTQ